MSYSQREIQICSDIRIMALSLKKVCGHDARKMPMTRGMDRIVEQCETLITSGPEEFHFIVARTSSAEELEHELRRSTYDR